jgi:hypothetical protein
MANAAHISTSSYRAAAAPPSEYLNDHTAFDAFIEYITVDDQRGFLGIETKLTEPFSMKHYDTPAYRRWMTGDGPWREDAFGKVDEIQHNQLWRDHLLAIATLKHLESPYSRGRLMLLRHPDDEKCAEVSRNYQRLLRSGEYTFVDMPLNRLMDFVDNVDQHGDHRDWLAAFRLRYLDLSASKEDFDAWNGHRR